MRWTAAVAHKEAVVGGVVSVICDLWPNRVTAAKMMCSFRPERSARTFFGRRGGVPSRLVRPDCQPSLYAG